MEKVDTVALGAHVRDLRKRARLTQARLAESAGIEVQSLSRIERGEYEPSLSACMALADALGVSIDVIARGQPAGPDTTSAPLRALMRTAMALEPEQVELFVRLMRELVPKRRP
jgi:transcriptional regulator with XRE-family HTH domain